MLQFLDDVLCKHSRGSLSGRGERAKVVYPFGIGHLQRRFIPRGKDDRKGLKQTFDLVHFACDLLEGRYNPN
jgi:hypothetical protein